MSIASDILESAIYKADKLWYEHTEDIRETAEASQQMIKQPWRGGVQSTEAAEVIQDI